MYCCSGLGQKSALSYTVSVIEKCTMRDILSFRRQLHQWMRKRVQLHSSACRVSIACAHGCDLMLSISHALESLLSFFFSSIDNLLKIRSRAHESTLAKSAHDSRSFSPSTTASRHMLIVSEKLGEVSARPVDCSALPSLLPLLTYVIRVTIVALAVIVRASIP